MKVMKAPHLIILIVAYNIGAVLNMKIKIYENNTMLNLKLNNDDESIQNKEGENHVPFNILNRVGRNVVIEEVIGKGKSKFNWTRHNAAKNDAISTETVTENIIRSTLQDDYERNEKPAENKQNISIDLTEVISNRKSEFNWKRHEDTTGNVKVSMETKSNAQHAIKSFQDDFEKDQPTTIVDSKISNDSEIADGNSKDVTNDSEDSDKSEFKPTVSGLLYRRKREDDDDDEVEWIWDPCNKGQHPEALDGVLFCAKDHDGPCVSLDNRDSFGSTKCRGGMKRVKVGNKTLCLKRKKARS